jgi:hypothetical protein
MTKRKLPEYKARNLTAAEKKKHYSKLKVKEVTVTGVKREVKREAPPE